MDGNYDSVEDATQSIPLVADSTRVTRSENNDGTVKHEQKRDSGEDNPQTSPKTTESAKLLKSGNNDVNFKHVQHANPWDTPSSPKSSWQAVRRENLKVLGHSGNLGLSRKIGSTIASKKAREQLYSPKAAWSLSRSSEITVPRGGDILRLRRRRL